MSGLIINLIIQAISGAVGGNAIGAILKNFSLGPLGNTLAGAIGGASGGTILSALIPALAGGAGVAGATGGLDLGALAGQVVGGGASGAIVTTVIGLIMSAMRGKA